MLPTTIAYYIMQTIGLVGQIALTATFFHPKGVQRHITIPNNSIIWVLQCLSACLLLYTGYGKTTNVPSGLCKVQSALQYGAPPALSAAVVTLVSRVWYLTWTVNRQKTLDVSYGPVLMGILVALPYVVWGAVALAAGIISGDDVRRFDGYCATDKAAPGIISGVASSFFLIAAIIFQSWSLVIVYIRYRRSRTFGPRETGHKDTSLFVRISLFTVLLFIGLVLSLISVVSTWQASVSDLLLAAIAILIFIVFASQRDIMEAWRLVKSPSLSFSDAAQSTSVGSVGRNNKDRYISGAHQDSTTRINRRDMYGGRPNGRTLKPAKSTDFESRSSMESDPDGGYSMTRVQSGKATPLDDHPPIAEILITKEVVVLPDEPMSPRRPVSVSWPRKDSTDEAPK